MGQNVPPSLILHILQNTKFVSGDRLSRSDVQKTVRYEDPINFWMCKNWSCHNKPFNINKKCNFFIVMTYTHTQRKFCFYWPNLSQTAKCFVRETAFQPVQEHFTEKFSCNMYYDYRQGSSFQQCFLWWRNCFWDHSPSWSTLNKWYKIFQSGRTTFEERDRCGHLWPLLPKKTVMASGDDGRDW